MVGTAFGLVYWPAVCWGETPLPPPVWAKGVPPPAAAEKPLTYYEAEQKALKEKRPLIVWVGGNFCQECVKSSGSDFVHCFVPTFEGVSAPAIVVGVVDENKLLWAGEVTWWVEGDREFGHVPSIRNVIRRWRERRDAARVSSRVMTYSSVTTYQAPMMMRQPAWVVPAMTFRSRARGSGW
jgi:hypothetical protein